MSSKRPASSDPPTKRCAASWVTVTELRVVPPPATIQRHFDHLYGMEQFAKGEEAPFTSPEELWVHQVENEPSLYHCTFDLPR